MSGRFFRTFQVSFLALLLSSSAFGAKTSPMVSQVSKQRFEVSRSSLEKGIKDPLQELSTFQVSPSFASGFFSGIKVSRFSPTCILPSFGIKSGDVIEMVNGQPIRGPGDIMEIGEKLAKAKPGAKVRLSLKRGERDLVYTYLVVK